eukprot:CAMPEP_0174702460 /NCGR_PEP_ID=MMETSP1094-20130205/6740_1 /TAXON_ID=156173 /ORGANISM="Chrysochromulina brevifilum, Strain UTEX LB 985" /LENGTH=94 /DNA_ID=CAMNT_0015900237 /DNA_START=171 /DNA_END=458 /DNA_ORIENTATION=+
MLARYSLTSFVSGEAHAPQDALADQAPHVQVEQSCRRHAAHWCHLLRVDGGQHPQQAPHSQSPPQLPASSPPLRKAAEHMTAGQPVLHEGVAAR